MADIVLTVALLSLAAAALIAAVRVAQSLVRVLFLVLMIAALADLVYAL
jgi:hypothetical protein